MLPKIRLWQLYSMQLYQIFKKMNIQQAKAEVSSALVEVAEQMETILNHKAKIPQIEMDLILSNTQRLYSFLLVLNKLNISGKADDAGQGETPQVKPEEITKIIHTEVSKLREELFRTLTAPNKGNNGGNVEKAEPAYEPVTEPVPFSPPPAPKPQTGPSPEKLAAIKQNPYIGKTIMPNGLVEEKTPTTTPVETKPVVEMPKVEQPKVETPVFEKPVVEQPVAQVVAEPVVETPPVEFVRATPPVDYTKTTVNTVVEQNITTPANKVAENAVVDNTLGNRLRAKAIVSIKGAIGINEKFQYLNDLFKGSVQDYNESLDALNTFNNLEDAEAHFNQLRTKYGWDMENTSATGLYELVVRRYMK